MSIELQENKLTPDLSRQLSLLAGKELVKTDGEWGGEIVDWGIGKKFLEGLSGIPLDRKSQRNLAERQYLGDIYSPGTVSYLLGREMVTGLRNGNLSPSMVGTEGMPKDERDTLVEMIWDKTDEVNYSRIREIQEKDYSPAMLDLRDRLVSALDSGQLDLYKLYPQVRAISQVVNEVIDYRTKLTNESFVGTNGFSKGKLWNFPIKTAGVAFAAAEILTACSAPPPAIVEKIETPINYQAPEANQGGVVVTPEVDQAKGKLTNAEADPALAGWVGKTVWVTMEQKVEVQVPIGILSDEKGENNLVFVAVDSETGEVDEKSKDILWSFAVYPIPSSLQSSSSEVSDNQEDPTVVFLLKHNDATGATTAYALQSNSDGSMTALSINEESEIKKTDLVLGYEKDESGQLSLVLTDTQYDEEKGTSKKWKLADVTGGRDPNSPLPTSVPPSLIGDNGQLFYIGFNANPEQSQEPGPTNPLQPTPDGEMVIIKDKTVYWRNPTTGEYIPLEGVRSQDVVVNGNILTVTSHDFVLVEKVIDLETGEEIKTITYKQTIKDGTVMEYSTGTYQDEKGLHAWVNWAKNWEIFPSSPPFNELKEVTQKNVTSWLSGETQVDKDNLFIESAEPAPLNYIFWGSKDDTTVYAQTILLGVSGDKENPNLIFGFEDSQGNRFHASAAPLSKYQGNLFTVLRRSQYVENTVSGSNTYYLRLVPDTALDFYATMIGKPLLVSIPGSQWSGKELIDDVSVNPCLTHSDTIGVILKNARSGSINNYRSNPLINPSLTSQGCDTSFLVTGITVPGTSLNAEWKP